MNQPTEDDSRQTIGRAFGAAAAHCFLLSLLFTQRWPMPLKTGGDFTVAVGFTAAGPILALGISAADSE